MLKNMAYVENTFLNLIADFIPLQSSHTQSGNSSSTGTTGKGSNTGRPTSKEDDLSEKGEEQVARDDNANRE